MLYCNFYDLTKWDSIFGKWYKSGRKFRDLDSINGKKNIIFQRWLDHPSQDEFWQKMVPYKDDFSKIDIPILTTTGYYDGDQRGALYYLKEHYKYNKKAQHYLVIGPYNHPTGQSYPNNVLYNYKLDSVAKVSMAELGYEWFDYILKGKSKPKLLKDKINFQIMGTNQWDHVDKIEKTSNNSVKFYLNKNKSCDSAFKKPEIINSFIQTVDFKVREEKSSYYSTEKDSVSYDSSLMVLESEILDKDIVISGSFTGNLKVSINKKDFDVNIQLMQILPEGTFLNLSDYVGRASYAKNKEKRQLLIPNTIETIPVSNSSFVSKKINKGSKLVVIFGVNKNDGWQINYGSGKDVSEESIEDAKEPLQIKWYNDSYIEIPVLE